jgi:hypothetical protein
VVLLAALAAGRVAAAQDAPSGQVRFLSGFEMRAVSFGAGLGVRRVTEMAVPFGAIWQVNPRLTFDFGVSYARVTRTPENDTLATESVSGLTDLQVRGVYQIIPDFVVLTLGADVPTGKTALSARELPAAGAVASDLIPFPVTSFGSGANVTSGLAVAVPFAGWALGMGASYRISSGYTPLAGVDSAYRPGGEMRLRVGVDRLVGQGRVSLGFTYSTFTQDEFGGSALFRPGGRYITQASWSIPLRNLGLDVYAWDLYRGAGTVSLSGSRTEKQNLLALGAMASIQLGRNQLRPQLEYRRQTAGTDTMTDAGTLMSLSLRYGFQLTDGLQVSPALRFDTGSVVVNGAAISLTGWGLTLGLRATL